MLKLVRGLDKGTPSRRRSAVASGLATAVSTVVIQAAAAAAAVLLAHRFGRTEVTDGFFAAFAVYAVVLLAATSFRIVALPDLTRASEAGRLGAEFGAYAVALAAVAAPLVAVGILARRAIGDLLTGGLGPAASHIAARSIAVLVVAAACHLYAALCASALAATNSYRVAAVAYAAGALATLVVFPLTWSHGVIALAWGSVANGAVALAVSLGALLARGSLGRVRLAPDRVGGRLRKLAEGAAVPLALQALFVIAVRFATDLPVGSVTTLTYAYMLASSLVATTATSLALVTSAPLTRRGVDADGAAAHVVHTSWLSLTVITGAAGVFALVGGRVASAVLGGAFSGQAGHDLGRLVVYLAPWMLVSIALTVAYPLLFVLERGTVLVPLAIALPLVQVPLAWGLARTFELPGLAASLALTTLLALGVLMAGLSRRTLAVASLGLGRLAAVETALAAFSFGLAALVLGGIPAATAGLALYLGLLAAIRPRGLRLAWTYVRTLA